MTNRLQCLRKIDFDWVGEISDDQLRTNLRKLFITFKFFSNFEDLYILGHIDLTTDLQFSFSFTFIIIIIWRKAGKFFFQGMGSLIHLWLQTSFPNKRLELTALIIDNNWSLLCSFAKSGYSVVNHKNTCQLKGSYMAHNRVLYLV